MRPRMLLLMTLSAVLLATAAGCSKDDPTTATGPAGTTTAVVTTTAAPDTVVETGTTAKSETTTTAKPPPAPPTTKAPVTTPKPKAPTTTAFKASPTPTTTIRVPTAPQQFCDWSRSLLIEDKSMSFQQFAQARYDQTLAAEGVIPGDLRRDYDVIVAAYEQIKPAIDSGEVTTALAATQWYAKNDPGMYDQLVGAVQHVGTYRKSHC